VSVGMSLRLPCPQSFPNLIAYDATDDCAAHCPYRATACQDSACHTTDTGADCSVRTSPGHPGTPARERHDHQHRAAQLCYPIATHFVHLRPDRKPPRAVAESANPGLEFSVRTTSGVQPIGASLRQHVSVSVARTSRQRGSSLA